jgi:hypothetical protein
LLILAGSFPLVWLANERRKVARCDAAFGQQGFTRNVDPRPAWRAWLFGSDSVGYARSINIYNRPITDAEL